MTDKEKANIIKKLETQLVHLAFKWRGEDKIDSDKSMDVVNHYHKVVGELWLLGWRGDELTPDEELPTKLMPEYFVEWWKRDTN